MISYRGIHKSFDLPVLSGVNLTVDTGEMFALFGIYTKQKNQLTCSVITTTADPLFEKIHNGAKRMPMCIDPQDKDYMPRLQTEESLKEEFSIFKSIPLNTYPVSSDVLNSHIDSDTSEVIKEVNYKELM